MNAGTCWGKDTIGPSGRSVERPRDVTLPFTFSHLRAEKPRQRSSITTKARAGQSGVRIPIGAREFSLVQNLQNGSGPHTASYSVGTGVHLHIFSAEVKNEWSYVSTPSIRFIIY
jgi:hypothetical protein